MPAPTDDGGLPLSGVRVLDITLIFAGPYATMQLADWGAEVIRIESVSHFPTSTRGATPHPSQAMMDLAGNAGMGYPDDLAGEHPWNRSPTFNHHARNKRSMTVDLTTPEGQAILDRLIAVSDGLVENNAPATIEDLGITWERVSAVNPNFVLMRMPAFGVDGPYRGYRTLGTHMEAIAGHQTLRAYPHLSLDYAPQAAPSDAASGLTAAMAFAMGLRQRDRTGTGVHLEVSTAENFIPSLSEFVLDHSMNGRDWGQMGNEHWWLAPHNVYPCQGDDRWVTIVCRDEQEWRTLCDVMVRPELADDERFADNASRHEHRLALDEEIATWTRRHEHYWIMERLQAAGVPAGAVLHESEALRDPQFRARDDWQWITHPEAGTYRHVGRLWHAPETPHPAARHAPTLGQDNEYVYKALLGYSEDEYRAFEEAGHIGTEFLPGVP